MPTAGEQELQRCFQDLLDNAASEPDLVSTRIAEVWRCLAAQERNESLLGEVKVTLGRCVQVAELVNQTAEPIFKPLEAHAEAMQQLVNRVRVAAIELQPLSVPLQQLTTLYQQALAQVKANSAPLTVKARLFVPGMGHYLISQEIARKLASKTFEGKNVKGIATGSNFVAHLQWVFYKRNPIGENAFSPALEAAVVSFHELLGGGSAAPTGCLKLRDVAFKAGMDKQEYVLQAGLGTYGVSLDGMLSLQQWVAVFEAAYGDTRGVEALLEPRLMDEVKRGYGAMFNGEDVDIPTLLKLVFAEISSHPKDQRLLGFQGLDISEEGEKIEFEQTIREVGPLAGAWVFALICRYPKVMPGLKLGNLLNWYKAKEWLNRYKASDSPQAKVAFVKQWQQALDKDNSALAVLSTLFTLPKDGRADNYMVAIEAGTLKLVSIDNDISFHAPYHTGRQTYTKLLSVLLLLKEVMSQTLPEGVRSKLLAKSPENWILAWLKHPVTKEREFNAWQQEKLLRPADIEACGVCNNPYPWGIEPKAVELMYTSLQKLWGLLKAQPKVTLNQVFESLYPVAYAHYQAIQKRGLDPMTAYHQVEKTPLEDTGAVDRSQLPIFYVKQRPLIESVACLAKLFPWSGGDERVLSWLDQMGRMGLQETCLSKEAAQRLLPQAIKLSLPGAVQLLCCHDVSPILDASTQQTVFHLFAHTYTDDKLTDDEALAIWKSLFTIKGANINSRYERETLAVFTLFKGMDQKEARGAALLLEAMKHGLDVTLKCQDETLFMKALRLAEEDVRYRSPLHRLIPLGGAKGVPVARVVHYLVKTNDARCQELLTQEEPSVAWHFTLNALAPTFTPKEASFNAKTSTEMRYFIRAMIGRCPEKFQTMVCGSSLSSTPPPERYGRHLVFPYEEGIHKVHMKVNPEIPGYEYAFQQLALLFFDEELPQHTLFRLDVSGWLSRFVPILWSQTVPGENLQTLYKEDPIKAHQRLSRLEPVHVSRLICLTLLGLTEDGKPDNFVVQGRRLVSVDNDHAFIDAVTYPIRDGLPQPQLNLKSIVFCLDQMRHPLDTKVVARIRSWNLAESFKGWLDKLHIHHEALKSQFGMKSDELHAWGEAPADQTRIGILFEGRSFLDLYDRACRLQNCLKDKPGMSGFELLRELLPTTCPFYERAFAHTNPLDRFFKGIAEGRYLKNNEGHLTTKSNPVTFFSLKQLPKGSSFHTPSYCLGLLQGIDAEAKQVDAILKELQQGKIDALDRLRIPAHIEKVVNHVKFASLNEQQQLTLFARLVDPAKGIAFKKLRISSSPYFTDAHLLALLRTSPGLKQLILFDCPMLTHASIGELARLTPTLQVLSLNKLPKLQHLAFFYKSGTFSSKQPHFQGLPLLSCEHLSLTECPELVSLRFSAPCLQSLTITECPKLRIPSLVASLQRVPELKALRLPPLPPSAYSPLFATLSRQRRDEALLQLLIQAYPKPQEALSLPGVNLSDILEACVPFLKTVSPKTLHLPATSLIPQGVTALLKASLYPTLVTFDPAAPLKPEAMYTLQGHTSYVSTCCQLADGRILSGSADKTLKVWDPVIFQCLATLQGHKDKVLTCCQLADGRILSGSADKTLKVWDPVTFQCLATLKGHTYPVETCCQLADGRILSGSGDKTLKVWDPVTFQCLATLQGYTDMVLICCQLANSRILSGSGDNALKVWDPVTFQCLATLQEHTSYVNRCCQLADGRILSGSGDNALEVWDPVTFQCLATFKGHTDWVRTCCQLADGRIVSGSVDKTLKVWNVEATSSLSLEALKKLQHAACWAEGEGWLALFWKAGSGAEEALWQSLVVRFRLNELYQERFAGGTLSIFGSSASKQLRALWEALQAPEGLPLTTLKVVPANLKCAKFLVAASPKLEHLELSWKGLAALPRSLSPPSQDAHLPDSDLCRDNVPRHSAGTHGRGRDRLPARRWEDPHWLRRQRPEGVGSGHLPVPRHLGGTHEFGLDILPACRWEDRQWL
jgi:hypothetical protein